jgi:NADH-quinone oxidoreductase subunit F
MKIMIGQGSCGIASGAKKTAALFSELIQSHNLDIPVHVTGCLGLCYLEPIVDIYDDKGFLTRYTQVKPDAVTEIFESHLLKNIPLDSKVISPSGQAFLAKQTRIALRNCGVINPEEITEYIRTGGYMALIKALNDMTADEICDVISDSGLRGRGGGGFPTGRKWQQVKDQAEPVKYVVCNADEGDPGAFMDRSIMEGDPHKMLEGMIIAGVATGAQEGYIYVRAEYPFGCTPTPNCP